LSFLEELSLLAFSIGALEPLDPNNIFIIQVYKHLIFLIEVEFLHDRINSIPFHDFMPIRILFN